MNLQAIAVGFISVVNPSYIGSIRRNMGYATTPDGSRVPTFTQVDGVQMQVQAITGGDLKHLDSLNVQGVMRAVYVNTQVQGANRPGGKGGDELLIPTGVSKSTPDVYLVTQVLEPWDGGGWCKVAATLQVVPPDQ